MVAVNQPSAFPGRAPRVPARTLPHGRGIRAALTLLAPLAIAVGLLSAEEAFDLPESFMAVALVVGALVLAALLLVGLRDLLAAEARADAALESVASAEAVQRTRADELAGVLEASQSLVLTGEEQVDYLGMLSSITPGGATSFLVRTEDEAEVTVVAAQGPLAASVAGLVRTMADETPGVDGGLVASFSAAGHAVGMEIPRQHFAGFASEIEAALTILLVDHSGRCIGSLHIVDPMPERILEPTFVSLAQLVANHLSVAMENNALMARLRRELSANQRVGQQLLQASKMGAVGELAAAVAHQVNNPLTGILGFAELLLTELPADDPRHDEVAIIKDEAVRARTIVRALLEFARPRPPQRIPASLNDLARSTLKLVRVRAHEADVAIVADYGEVPCLELDPDAVKQVLLNLFNNAIDAMPAGGTLSVSAEQVGDRVRVVVGDTGIGMDEETRRHIFTPFFSTRAANVDGTGLGLSLSRRIVESHGGTIEVESALGEGAVFTVWLPASLEASLDPILATAAGIEPADAAALAGAQDVAAAAGLAGSRSTGCAGAVA
jgi:signal transduction histidine kinase